MDKISKLEILIEKKKSQLYLLEKEIEKLEEMKRSFYFSMMGGRGIY